MFPFAQRLSKEEKKELVSRYKTVEEGYVILYLEAEFKKRGYTVSRNNADTLFNLSDGRRKCFDFSLTHPHIDSPLFVDLDMGTLERSDYFVSLDKSFAVTTDIYIVTKDEQTLYNSAKYHSFPWLKERFNGVENVKGQVRLHFASLESLIVGEKVWEDIVF